MSKNLDLDLDLERLLKETEELNQKILDLKEEIRLSISLKLIDRVYDQDPELLLFDIKLLKKAGIKVDDFPEHYHELLNREDVKIVSSQEEPDKILSPTERMIEESENLLLRKKTGN